MNIVSYCGFFVLRAGALLYFTDWLLLLLCNSYLCFCSTPV